MYPDIVIGEGRKVDGLVERRRGEQQHQSNDPHECEPSSISALLGVVFRSRPGNDTHAGMTNLSILNFGPEPISRCLLLHRLDSFLHGGRGGSASVGVIVASKGARAGGAVVGDRIGSVGPNHRDIEVHHALT